MRTQSRGPLLSFITLNCIAKHSLRFLLASLRPPKKCNVISIDFMFIEFIVFFVGTSFQHNSSVYNRASRRQLQAVATPVTYVTKRGRAVRPTWKLREGGGRRKPGHLKKPLKISIRITKALEASSESSNRSDSN